MWLEFQFAKVEEVWIQEQTWTILMEEISF